MIYFAQKRARIMFNGLIKEIADVKSFSGNLLSLKAKYHPNLGDSIAVNGACLSVVKLTQDGFVVELSAETRAVIATENLTKRVHIEPAMKLGERFDGHIVQGHVDYVGKIVKISTSQNGKDFYIKLPQEAMKFVSSKGSIAVEGVSLTINEVIDAKNQIRLTIIPITLRESLFGEFIVGRKVNIESDIFARYIARILGFKKGLTWEEVERISSLY